MTWSDMSYLPPESPAVAPVTLPPLLGRDNGFWLTRNEAPKPHRGSHVIDGMGTSHEAWEGLQVDIATISNSSRIYENA